MSVNLRHGINQEETTRSFGPTFGTIDFDPAPTSKVILETRGNKAKAGTFHIGGKQFELTLAELDRAIETLQTGKSMFYQKYRFGM